MSKKPGRPARAVSRPPKKQTPSLSQRLDRLLADHPRRYFVVIPVVVGLLFALLHFDLKISEGNDDSMYIEAAYKYSKDYFGYFYTANAPLYPMVLGVVAAVTGLSLPVFKSLSLLFFLTHLWLMYLAFRGRAPRLVLWPAIALAAVNSYFLYYASQTYTEMLFMCVLMLFFRVFFRGTDRLERSDEAGWGSLARFGLATGAVLLLLTLCKNIAIGMVGAVVLYFAVQRRWKPLAAVVAGYGVVRAAWEGLKALVWGAAGQYGSQGAILLRKDAYNPASGNEDVAGFINRFFTNYDLYLSKRLFQILGFRDPDTTKTYTILSLAVTAVAAFALWRIAVEWRRRRQLQVVGEGEITARYAAPMLLVWLFVATQFFLTFLVLQISWDQPRLIMVYVPLLVMVVLYGFYSYFHPSAGGNGGRAYLAIVAVLLASSLITTVKKGAENYSVMVQNLKGDKYYGYTPDWENFLKLSEWCADNLPDDAVVASRKAPMSFVYGRGREFFPIYTTVAVNPATNQSYPDSALQYFHDNNIRYVLIASLRRNPAKNDGYVINTLQRMVNPIMKQYPDKIKLIKTIGNNEPASLYEVR